MGNFINKILMFSVLAIILSTSCGVSSQQDSAMAENKDLSENLNIVEAKIHIFGDSIFATLNHRIRDVLVSKTKMQILDHSQTGKWAWEIKKQYESQRHLKPEIVVMDAGGNDVLGNSSECKNFSKKCQMVIENAARIVESMFATMAEDGVKNVVFLGAHYPRGWNSGYDAAVDYGHDLMGPICSMSPTPCQIVDPRQRFSASSNLLEWDGVHPNAAGAQVMADLIYEKLPLFTIKPVGK